MPHASSDLEAALGDALGGRVVSLRQVGGGASRITSTFDLETDSGTRPLVLQVDRGATDLAARVNVEAALLRAAAAAGVPVADVVATGRLADGDRAWLVVTRLDGETIPRRIFRTDDLAPARAALAAQCGTALAAIHRIDPGSVPGLPDGDPVSRPLELLDQLDLVRPVLELGVRWLARTATPGSRRVTVHGDFRMGNLLIGQDGLRAVLDWELAHVGDPVEDLGWLCARAWRFGAAGHVGGVGDVASLLGAYEAAGGEHVELERLRWWECAAAVRWAVICALQCAAHQGGGTRSVELAAIGRRVCESEWDLLLGLGLACGEDATERPAATARSPLGPPSADELVGAVVEYLEGQMAASPDARVRFEARVARNALSIVEREVIWGDAIAAAHARRLATLGYSDDRALATALRAGELDGSLRQVGEVLACSARDQLVVNNPAYLLDPSE